jgi:hypothetical protein
MKYIIFLFIHTLLCLGTTSASVKRIEITKSNELNSPIKFSIELTKPFKEHHKITLMLPKGQEKLTHIWKVFLNNKHIGVPIDPVIFSNGKRKYSFSSNIEILKKSTISIRCGKHAPMNETIYKIDLSSYLENL